MTDTDDSTIAKQRLVAVFDRASGTYEDVGVAFFTRWGRRLVEHSGIGADDRVLDVGCGSGAVLLPAAEAVGPTGHVVGIDLAEGMVERCRSLCATRSLSQVEVRLGDAEAPGVDDGSFDAVLAGLVLFFLPHPGEALEAYRRALVPGGTLAFSTFGDEDDRFLPVYAAIAAHAPTPPPRTTEPDGEEEAEPRLDQGPFQTPDGIAELLAAHGFGEVRTVTEANEVHFDDPEQWIAWSWSHGARAMWESVPDERLDAAHADGIAALRALGGPDGSLVQHTNLRYTTATAG